MKPIPRNRKRDYLYGDQLAIRADLLYDGSFILPNLSTLSCHTIWFERAFCDTNTSSNTRKIVKSYVLRVNPILWQRFKIDILTGKI